jgi:DNA polymerase III epsilon subunit-like protein
MIKGRSTPTLQDLWQQLDRFFVNPTIREKAMQFLRTTKQGNGELIPHVQSFDLKFLEAGLDSASDAQKINYLKNSLNKRLLRYQVGYQPLTQETYEQFVQRMRFT